MTVTDAAESFRQAAWHYLSVIDGATELPAEAFLDRVADSMIELHQRALALPDVEGAGGVAADGMDHEAWKALFMRLGDLLGERQLYWLVHDPTDHADHVPVASSLADDLADIYCDVRRGLDLWDRGTIEDVIWEWRFSFWSHWGAHLVDGLRTVHFLQARARLKAEAG